MKCINHTNYKNKTYHKSFTSLKLLDYKNKLDQELLLNTDKAVIFIPSIKKIKILIDDIYESLDEIFEDFLIDILYEHSGIYYTDDDIAIVLTPEDELKSLFGKNYQKGYAYFLSIKDDFFMVFDNN